MHLKDYQTLQIGTIPMEYIGSRGDMLGCAIPLIERDYRPGQRVIGGFVLDRRGVPINCRFEARYRGIGDVTIAADWLPGQKLEIERHVLTISDALSNRTIERYVAMREADGSLSWVRQWALVEHTYPLPTDRPALYVNAFGQQLQLLLNTLGGTANRREGLHHLPKYERTDQRHVDLLNLVRSSVENFDKVRGIAISATLPKWREIVKEMRAEGKQDEVPEEMRKAGAIAEHVYVGKLLADELYHRLLRHVMERLDQMHGPLPATDGHVKIPLRRTGSMASDDALGGAFYAFKREAIWATTADVTELAKAQVWGYVSARPGGSPTSRNLYMILDQFYRPVDLAPLSEAELRVLIEGDGPESCWKVEPVEIGPQGPMGNTKFE